SAALISGARQKQAAPPRDLTISQPRRGHFARGREVQRRGRRYMDSFRGFEDEAALSHAHDDEPAPERPPEIGVDERRMHVRAYNYWVSLLNGRPYPSIGDVDPHTIEDFGGNSALLDFSQDPQDPQIAFLGRALRDECGVDQSIQNISQVPS